jgi:crotonobetainyl-CoA:carnitine CoA-transferase CaiB-like acyl-CoA transferase
VSNSQVLIYSNLSEIVRALLTGLKILDFSTLLPGPYATMILADLGAEVLHVESLHRKDMVRDFEPKVAGKSAIHAYINRNKRSITVDLKHPDAKKIIHKLIKEYNIVVEQFRPGVMKRLGFDYNSLKSINSNIIYCSLTSYGQNGPYATRAGHDINFLAQSGISSFTGSHKEGPYLPGFQLADLSGSLYLVIGLLSAVINRMHEQQGQHIDIAMKDCVYSLAPIQNSQWFVGKDLPSYEDGILNSGSIYGFYRTQDGKYLSIGSLEPKFLRQLSEGLEMEDINPNNLVNPEIKEKMSKRISEETLDYWIQKFNSLDACVEAVLDLEEVEDHPQTKARNLVTQVGKENNPLSKQVAHPIKYSSYDPIYRNLGQNLGESTIEVLHEIGISEEEIQDYQTNGVI